MRVYKEIPNNRSYFQKMEIAVSIKMAQEIEKAEDEMIVKELLKLAEEKVEEDDEDKT
jgi:hypothetical protein